MCFLKDSSLRSFKRTLVLMGISFSTVPMRCLIHAEKLVEVVDATRLVTIHAKYSQGAPYGGFRK